MRTMLRDQKMSPTILFTLLLGLLLVVVTSATRILLESPHLSTVDAVVVTRDHDNSLHRRPTTTTQKELRGARTRDRLEVYDYFSSERETDRKEQPDGSKSKQRAEKVTYESDSMSTVDTPTSPTRSFVGSLVTSDDGSNKLGKHISENNSEEQEPAPSRQGTPHDEGGRGEMVIVGSRGKRTRNKGNGMQENGNDEEHVRKVDVDVYRRQIPKISVAFRMEGDTSYHGQRQRQQHTPLLVDYNELSQVSEEFVNQFFRTILEEEEELQVRLHEKGVHVFLSVNEDHPFVLDFVVTLAFVIPGHVPTVKFLSDRLHDGLQRHQQLGNDNEDERDTTASSSTSTTTTGPFFVADLQNTMSLTNPFSKTVSIEIIRRSDRSLPVTPSVPGDDAVTTRGNTALRPSDSRRFINSMTTTELCKHILIASFLAGLGCIILLAMTMRFMWEKQKKRQYEDTTSITTAATTTAIISEDDHSATTTTTTDQTFLALAFDDDNERS